jgi:hypothetical protein
MVSGSDISLPIRMREIGRALLNARPIGATGALGRAGDDLVNHDGIERFVNHQGARDGQHRIAVSNDQRLGLGEAVTAEAIRLLRFNFTCLKGWFDMRNLGGVLDHEEPLPQSGMRSSAVALRIISAEAACVGAMDAGTKRLPS